jgi:predicted AAA+ superfamily ATPase
VRSGLNLLETSYQLVRIPAYAVNRTKRLIKTPRLYWADTGLALHLSGGEPGGAHLENLVLGDLLAWRDSRPRHAEVLYWRTTNGEEVDFVLEVGRTLVPIDVKMTPKPRVDDARHLKLFRQEYRTRARAGLLLHTGDRVEWLAPGILAAPWWRVL